MILAGWLPGMVYEPRTGPVAPIRTGWREHAAYRCSICNRKGHDKRNCPRPYTPRFCLNCGEEFRSKHKETRCCGNACASMLRRRKPATVEAVCTHCSRVFTSEKDHVRRTCSRKCAKAALRASWIRERAAGVAAAEAG